MNEYQNPHASKPKIIHELDGTILHSYIWGAVTSLLFFGAPMIFGANEFQAVQATQLSSLSPLVARALACHHPGQRSWRWRGCPCNSHNKSTEIRRQSLQKKHLQFIFMVISWLQKWFGNWKKMLPCNQAHLLPALKNGVKNAVHSVQVSPCCNSTATCGRASLVVLLECQMLAGKHTEQQRFLIQNGCFPSYSPDWMIRRGTSCHEDFSLSPMSTLAKKKSQNKTSKVPTNAWCVWN